jgi:predicted alpha/beta-hydrolase family hydrolase
VVDGRGGGREHILKQAWVLVVYLEEAGVHDLNGREVNGLAVAPLVNNRAEEVAALAVGLVVEGEDV